MYRNIITPFVPPRNTHFQIQKALASRMEMNTKLEQDDMEGVADEEWAE